MGNLYSMTGSLDAFRAIVKAMAKPTTNLQPLPAILTGAEEVEVWLRALERGTGSAEALAGTYGMAQFIREAIDAELERREALANDAQGR